MRLIEGQPRENPTVTKSKPVRSVQVKKITTAEELLKVIGVKGATK